MTKYFMGLNTTNIEMVMLTEQAGNPGNVGFTRVFTDNSDGNKAPLVAALMRRFKLWHFKNRYLIYKLV